MDRDATALSPTGANSYLSRLGGAFLAIPLLFGFAVAACQAGEEIPFLERRAQVLNRSIMCPVCPGESIDQSQNELAVQMRAIVDEQLAQGRTEEQIKAFFVERYGPSVLLEPPRSGVGLVLWLLPPVVLLIAVSVLAFVLRSMRGTARARNEGLDKSEGLSEEERAEFFQRIEAVVEHADAERGPMSAGSGPDEDLA